MAGRGNSRSSDYRLAGGGAEVDQVDEGKWDEEMSVVESCEAGAVCRFGEGDSDAPCLPFFLICHVAMLRPDFLRNR